MSDREGKQSSDVNTAVVLPARLLPRNHPSEEQYRAQRLASSDIPKTQRCHLQGCVFGRQKPQGHASGGLSADDSAARTRCLVSLRLVFIIINLQEYPMNKLSRLLSSAALAGGLTFGGSALAAGAAFADGGSTTNYQAAHQKGHDNNGHNKDDHDKGYNKDGRDRDGYDKDGFDRSGHDRWGYERDGYDRNGYDCNGYDRHGNDRHGHHSKWHGWYKHENGTIVYVIVIIVN